MISLKLCRNTLIRLFVVLAIISSFLNTPAHSQESEDSQIFISGFNAFQQKNYVVTITKMNEVLQKYPDSPLRDMVLFWLSRAHFKNGNQQDAARYLSQFSREYPDNPLKGTADEELLALTARYEKGEQLPTGSEPVVALKADQGRERLARERAEQDRLAALQKEQERAAALSAEAKRKAGEKAEQERVTAFKAEEERLTAEKAAMARRAAEEAEQARLTALQKEQERAAALSAEAKRRAGEKAEQERIAAEERLTVEKAARAKRAAEAAEQDRLAALQKEQERAAALSAEAKRKAGEKAEQERIAAFKAEEERLTAEKAAMARRTAEEAEQARLAAVRAEQQKAESEKVDMELVARQQAEMIRLTMAKAEQKRLAALKVEEERADAAKALKAEQKRTTAAKAEDERSAAAIEEKRLAAVKSEEDRLSAEKADRQRVEREKIELGRRTVAAAESARLAAAKKEQERVAAQRIEKELQAAAAAEITQKAVARQESPRTVAPKAETRPQARNINAPRAALREKAIAQYKSILEKYPASKAAGTAAAKLKELGVAVALPQAAAVEPLPENGQVLRFEVAQFAGLEFILTAKPQAYTVSQRISIPFEITNRGNGNDSFYLESGFPAEFAAGFAAASQPELALNQTSPLAPGESFKGVINLVIPPASIDGLRISYPVKAASRLLSEATQSREVSITAAAPLLRALVKTDKNLLLPGEKALYRVTVLNVGSTMAQDVSLRLNFPPQLEAVDYATAGFRLEMKSAVILDGLQIKTGESKEFSLIFQLKDGSLAGQELLLRAELVNIPLKTAAVFVSNVAHVRKKHGVLVRTASERQIVIPGQTLAVPFVVTNTGNVREKFTIASSVNSAQEAIIFQDLNRDGSRQANEPIITEIGPLAPQEEASIVMEIKTPRSAGDGTQGSAQIVFSPEGDTSRSASGSTQLVYSRPVLQMAMTGREGRLKPGEVTSFDLDITNRGSSLARIVELRGTWPEQLELVAADPSSSSISNGTILWYFKELGAGEKRTIKVSFRVKPGTGVGTNIQVKNVMSYEDQLGNRY